MPNYDNISQWKQKLWPVATSSSMPALTHSREPLSANHKQTSAENTCTAILRTKTLDEPTYISMMFRGTFSNFLICHSAMPHFQSAVYWSGSAGTVGPGVMGVFEHMYAWESAQEEWLRCNSATCYLFNMPICKIDNFVCKCFRSYFHRALWIFKKLNRFIFVFIFDFKMFNVKRVSYDHLPILIIWPRRACVSTDGVSASGQVFFPWAITIWRN